MFEYVNSCYFFCKNSIISILQSYGCKFEMREKNNPVSVDLLDYKIYKDNNEDKLVCVFFQNYAQTCTW